MAFVRVAFIAEQANALARASELLQLSELGFGRGSLDVLVVDAPQGFEIARSGGFAAFGGGAEFLQMQVCDARLIETGG